MSWSLSTSFFFFEILCFFSFLFFSLSVLSSFHLQKSLEHTSKLLAAAREDLKQTQYTLKQKDFVISEQKKAGLYN